MDNQVNSELIDLSEFGMTDEELFAHFENDNIESERITAPRYSYWKSVFRVFFRKKINIVILALFAVVVLFTYVYPMVSNYDRLVNQLDSASKHLDPPSAISYFGFQLKYILGTGSLGEPTFDAVWNGARISLSLAFVCAAINMTVGVVIGAIWGFSKKLDMIMMELYNIIANVPYILIISVLVMVLSGSFWTMVFAMTITGWLGIAYFIRTQVIIIRDREYNLASRCLGTSVFRIALRNILPFMTSVIVTLLATELPSYISYEVFLSYIGIGLKDMSLGRLIYSAESSMLIPGWAFEFWSPVAISAIITIVLYIVGQNLGDASDPRTHM
ncbi:MAG: ABC transporter permease [Clostridia bacterium]|nr:ABC transporter permease [Clostridia bacterium]